MQLPALIAEKTIFDLLGMLDSGERLLGDLFLFAKTLAISNAIFVVGFDTHSDARHVLSSSEPKAHR